MDEPQRARDDATDLSLTGPGGWGAKYRGSNELLLMLLLVAVIACVIIYTMMNHEANAKERDAAQLMRETNIVNAIQSLDKSQNKNARAIIYVQVMDEKHRRELNFEKPELLREMQR